MTARDLTTVEARAVALANITMAMAVVEARPESEPKTHAARLLREAVKHVERMP